MRFLKKDLDSLDPVFEMEKNIEQCPSLNDHDYIRQCGTKENFENVMSSLRLLANEMSDTVMERNRDARSANSQTPSIETELIHDFEKCQHTVTVSTKPIIDYKFDKLNKLIERSDGFERILQVLNDSSGTVGDNSVIITPYYLWLCRYNCILRKHHKSLDSLNLNNCLSVVTFLFRLALKWSPTAFEEELFHFLLAYSRANFSKQLVLSELKRFKNSLATQAIPNYQAVH